MTARWFRIRRANRAGGWWIVATTAVVVSGLALLAALTYL